LIGGSKAQTAMTHNSQNVIESAEFFAKVAWAVLRGDAPAKAVKNLQQEDFNRAPYAEWITKGMQTTQTDTRTAIAGFGQTCDAAAAFPCVIHLITRYENDLRGALVENAMAGGDSAARGLLTGMVLGAHLGVEAIPKSWLADMKHSQRINDLLDKLDSQLS
jgi:ADP-ribosylglycohydrolase